jgi:hypothetical protein
MNECSDRRLETAAPRNKIVLALRELIIIYAVVTGRASSAGSWTGQAVVFWNTFLLVLCTIPTLHVVRSEAVLVILVV